MQHLSKNKKIILAGVAVLGGYLVYRHFYGSASAATLPTPAPAGGGALPAHLPPLPSPYPVTGGGNTSYTVTTASTPLNLRQGPGTSYPVIGALAKGATVAATGNITANPTDGFTWIEIADASGNSMGWAAAQYLTTAGPPAQATTGFLGYKQPMRRYGVTGFAPYNKFAKRS